MAEIKLVNLSKRWGGFVGVDNFNLTITDREFLVLLAHRAVARPRRCA